MKQYSDTVLMIEPGDLRINSQTVVNNYLKTKPEDHSAAQEKALKELRGMVAKFREHGVNVIVLQDTLDPHTPDSIFPNNWISFHENKMIALYPMFAKNRRVERREDDVLALLEEKDLEAEEIMDYSSAEEDKVYVKGTGSIRMNRVNKITNACVT